MTYTAAPLHPTHLAAALSLALASSFAFAQQAPDAGQLLQQDRPAQKLPKTDTTIPVAPPESATVAPGGAVIALKGVRFTGNTIFTSEELAAVLGDVTREARDLAGLQTLVQGISAHYRAAGYPFARAMIPQQKLADGVLEVNVIEGRYGKVSTTGDTKYNAAAERFLVGLAPGSVIESSSLERATLILSDQPGIKTAPLMRPGQETGTGDLVVDIMPTPGFKGEVGLDNHNNRYTGEYRARVSLQWDSPFMLGDQITLRSNVSNEGQWLGNLGYNLPIGTSDLRGYLGYAHTSYELKKEFATLDATGKAHIASVGLSYPLVRSARTNLVLAGTYQHKILDDKQGETRFKSTKKSHGVPLMLQFDHRDSLGGGGITYGSISYTAGRIDLGSTLKPFDAVSAKTQGGFSKWNLDLARIQATPLQNFTLFGRVSAQWANKNLDSSEDFGLGGPNGVRAYPMGEGFGDQGWFTQIEARYQIGNVSPYAFYDAGRVTINKSPWAAGTNSRKLSGYGVGVRYDDQKISLDASLAWRAQGGKPTSDTRDRTPRLWVTAGFRF